MTATSALWLAAAAAAATGWAWRARPGCGFLAQIDAARGDGEQERFLRGFASRGVAYVSFGDRGPDASLYDAFLELNDDGSWKWTDIRQPPLKK